MRLSREKVLCTLMRFIRLTGFGQSREIINDIGYTIELVKVNIVIITFQ